MLSGVGGMMCDVVLWCVMWCWWYGVLCGVGGMICYVVLVL